MNLVEEDRTGAGELEEAVFPGDRTSESPLFVTEKLGLKQRFGDRGAIDSDKGLVCSRARVVNAARKKLLTRSGLADQKHGRPPRRTYAARQIYRVPDGPALPDDVLESKIGRFAGTGKDAAIGFYHQKSRRLSVS
jgi:hypothetical protein